jgi:hypothetical protein
MESWSIGVLPPVRAQDIFTTDFTDFTDGEEGIRVIRAIRGGTPSVAALSGLSGLAIKTGALSQNLEFLE